MIDQKPSTLGRGGPQSLVEGSGNSNQLVGSFPYGDEKVFNLLPCPRRFSEELQAGLHRRIVLETPNIDAFAQFVPAEVLNQVIHDLL